MPAGLLIKKALQAVGRLRAGSHWAQAGQHLGEARMEQELMQKYARLIVKTGVNIQEKQTLVIISPLECAPFARELAKVAYLEGARDVVDQLA